MVVGNRDRGTSNAETMREFTGWRQDFARSQSTINDGTSYLSVDLSAEVLALNQADVEFHRIIICARAENWTGQLLRNWLLL
jgi:hypothetical protein